MITIGKAELHHGDCMAYLVLNGVSVYNTQKPYLIHKKESSCKQSIKKRLRDICGLKKMAMGNFVSNIALFGSGITENCRWVCRYTTLISIKQITTLLIYSLSHRLSTNGSTLAAELSMENGKSHAQYALSISQPQKSTGISPEDGLTGSCAKNASFKKALKQEKYLSQMGGSVKIIHKKTNVYDAACKRIEQATAQQRMFP